MTPHLSPRACAIAAFAALTAVLTGPAGARAPDPVPASAPTPPPSASLPVPMTAPDFHLGNPKAKVTVIEYASDTCPHCARFDADVFPEFRKKWVDTGKVLYVFREFPTDPAPLSTAGFVVARCAGDARYLDVVEALFKAQKTANTGLEFLTAGGRAGGLDEAQVRACLANEAALKDVQTRASKAADADKITGVPTLIVNGQALPSGEKTLEQLDAAIIPLLPQKHVAARAHTGKT